MIYIVNKRRKLESIQKEYPNADILDLTSKSEYAKQLSPFYPHGNIPIPFSKGETATCVEAVWQGLKVFENFGVDFDTFRNNTMKNLKRTVRKYGQPKGHQKGIYSRKLLDYFQARVQIYLPTYKWMLDNISSVKNLLLRISERAKTHDLVFLDFNTNYDYRDLSTPLSHAGLIKLYIENQYPNPSSQDQPYTLEQLEERKNKIKESKKKTNKRKKAKKEKITEGPSLF